MPLPLKSFAKKFFHQNYQLLKKYYPGISYHRLIQELEDIGADIEENHFPQIPSSQVNLFFNSLLKGIPLEYIGGKCYFFRSCFEIKKTVFIPRPETELLVEDAAKELHFAHGTNPKTPLKILDVGTGSGNILISLLQEYPGPMEAIGVDISKTALDLSQRNAFRLQYTFSKNKKIRFLQSDRLSQLSQKFHLIVSNPPYIKKKSEQMNVHPQVTKWEPHDALYLEDSFYQNWFKEFFIQIKHSLAKNGCFFMEGHETHLKNLWQLAENTGGFSSIKIKNDYTSRNRFLILRK